MLVINIFTTDLTDRTDWTDKYPVSAGSKTKTKINPLERMEGCALMACFRLGLIRASS